MLEGWGLYKLKILYLEKMSFKNKHKIDFIRLKKSLGIHHLNTILQEM